MKFPVERAKLINALSDIETLTRGLQSFARVRSEWQDDEDDCLNAALRQVKVAEDALAEVREILLERP